MAMQSARPNRFGGGPVPTPGAVANKAAPVGEKEAEAPALAPVPAAESAPEPAPEPAPEEKAAPATPKKTTTKKPARSLKTADIDVLRKSVEWTAEVEELFQDGCDDWYGDRRKRERKRRLGRRPSDNKLITALVLLGLEAIEKDDAYNNRLEELLPADARRRNN
ncbi:hypothetical protein Br6_04805 [Rhodococcus sp. Br-6]|nr:hypothetical protein Br6_04805 [Rhodococcus sp. Br-6]